MSKLPIAGPPTAIEIPAGMLTRLVGFKRAAAKVIRPPEIEQPPAGDRTTVGGKRKVVMFWPAVLETC
jgi:hypothetical protein